MAYIAETIGLLFPEPYQCCSTAIWANLNSSCNNLSLPSHFFLSWTHVPDPILEPEPGNWFRGLSAEWMFLFHVSSQINLQPQLNIQSWHFGLRAKEAAGLYKWRNKRGLDVNQFKLLRTYVLRSPGLLWYGVEERLLSHCWKPKQSRLYR